MNARMIGNDRLQAVAEGCQADSLEGASRPVPRVADLMSRARELLRREGAWAAFAKISRFFVDRGSAPAAPQVAGFGSVRGPSPEEVLNLRPGELVEVKPLPEILATLDAAGKLRGLAFLPGMQPFCGKQFRVLRRMETLYQEESGQVRRLKHTVLLADVQCDGLLMKCDRLCYLFWREAWLRRIAEKDDATTSAKRQEFES